MLRLFLDLLTQGQLLGLFLILSDLVPLRGRNGLVSTLWRWCLYILL